MLSTILLFHLKIDITKMSTENKKELTPREKFHQSTIEEKFLFLFDSITALKKDISEIQKLINDFPISDD